MFTLKHAQFIICVLVYYIFVLVHVPTMGKDVNGTLYFNIFNTKYLRFMLSDAVHIVVYEYTVSTLVS